MLFTVLAARSPDRPPCRESAPRSAWGGWLVTGRVLRCHGGVGREPLDSRGDRASEETDGKRHGDDHEPCPVLERVFDDRPQDPTKPAEEDARGVPRRWFHGERVLMLGLLLHQLVLMVRRPSDRLLKPRLGLFSLR